MNLRRRWTVGTAIGFCGAFISFPLGEGLMRACAPASIADIRIADLPAHLRPETLPAWMDLTTYETLYQYGLLAHIPGLLVFGAIVALPQYLILRPLLPRAWLWIAGTSVGFTLVLLFEAVEPHIVTGPTAGPVEPLMIVFGGGALAGVLQWLYLRSHAGADWRYPAFWMLGLVAGVAVAVPAMMGIGTVVGDAIGRLARSAPRMAWGIEIGLFGLIFGSAAGFVGSYGLREIVPGGREGEAPETAELDGTSGETRP